LSVNKIVSKYIKLKAFLGALPFLIFSFESFGQKDYKAEVIRLKEVLEANHLAPPKIDDLFAVSVFDLFLDKIDQDRIYLTSSDVEELGKLRNQLDEEFSGRDLKFLAKATALLKSSLERCIQNIDLICKTPVTAKLKQPIIVSYQPPKVRATPAEALSMWQRKISYEVFQKVYGQTQLELDLNSKEPQNENFFLANEKKAREAVAKAETRKIKRILNHPLGLERYLSSALLYCYAACFDGHSAYFIPTEMQNFLSSFGAEGYSFGLGFEEEEGELVVDEVEPGSAAWHSGRISPTDKIIQVKIGNRAIDLRDADLAELDGLLSQSGNAVVEFVVKKQDGSLKTVALKQEKKELRENIVRSYLLTDNHKIGYIALPGFYTPSGEANEGLRCANDVAKEIVKLKKEKIEGLILDLRSNGGGSLQEALAMAGIFIEEGPLGALVGKDKLPHLIKDNNRGTVYDGPLIILVNSFSASASEFLAAALQDYQRAIVVGSSTYGKGTSQTLLPLDKTKSVKDPLASDQGFAKVTVHRIYRVTGKSVQEKGVQPDIILPDVLKVFAPTEKDTPHFIKADSISKRIVFTKLQPTDVKLLQAKSNERISLSKEFIEINNLHNWFKERMKTDRTIGSWSDFVNFLLEYEKRILELDKTQSSTPLTVQNHQMDKAILAVDDYWKEINESYLEDLRNDLYIREASLILSDYIRLNKK
jgi:carboxyl-terminal processing protease